MAAVPDQDHPESIRVTPMSKARDLINAHLYPVLATFAVVYGAIQIAPIAHQARNMNICVQQGLKAQPNAVKKDRNAAIAYSVVKCNGNSESRWLLH